MKEDRKCRRARDHCRGALSSRADRGTTHINETEEFSRVQTDFRIVEVSIKVDYIRRLKQGNHYELSNQSLLRHVHIRSATILPFPFARQLISRVRLTALLHRSRYDFYEHAVPHKVHELTPLSPNLAKAPETRPHRQEKGFDGSPQSNIVRTSVFVSIQNVAFRKKGSGMEIIR